MTPLTLRLWYLLSIPSKGHPLYRRVASPRAVSGWQRLMQTLITPVAPVLYLGVIMLGCCAATSTSSGVLVMAGVLSIVLFNGTLYGLGWSAGIAARLAGEREHGSFDLLCLLPGGGLGVAWAAASGELHRDNRFTYRYRRHLLVLRLIALTAIALALGALLDRRSVLNAGALTMLVAVIGLVFASWLDYVQSVVLAALAGIIAGMYAGSRFDAETFAWMLLLALQVAVYAAALVIGFALLPALAAAISVSDAVREVLLVAGRVAVLYALHEWAIAALWRIAAGRLNTSTRQLDGLFSVVA